MGARNLTRIQLPFQTAGAAHDLKKRIFSGASGASGEPISAQSEALGHANGVSRGQEERRLRGSAQRGDREAAETDVSVAVRGLLLKDSQLKALTLKGQRPALTAAAVHSPCRRQPS